MDTLGHSLGFWYQFLGHLDYFRDNLVAVEDKKEESKELLEKKEGENFTENFGEHFWDNLWEFWRNFLQYLHFLGQFLGII